MPKQIDSLRRELASRLGVSLEKMDETAAARRARLDRDRERAEEGDTLDIGELAQSLGVDAAKLREKLGVNPARAKTPDAPKVVAPGDDDVIEDEGDDTPVAPAATSNAKLEAAKVRMAKAIAELEAAKAECDALMEGEDEETAAARANHAHARTLAEFGLRATHSVRVVRGR